MKFSRGIILRILAEADETFTLPNACWRVTPEAFAARLRRCCADINATLDVEGLCRDFPKRVQMLLEKEGGRLKQ